MTRKTKPQPKPTTLVTVSPDTPYLRIKEAAAYLRVADWAIGAAIREGKLPHLQIGKRYILLRDDLDKFAVQNRVAA
jgi:excisionase family DNA binding protein